jgi:hypothetical protein
MQAVDGGGSYREVSDDRLACHQRRGSPAGRGHSILVLETEPLAMVYKGVEKEVRGRYRVVLPWWSSLVRASVWQVLHDCMEGTTRFAVEFPDSSVIGVPDSVSHRSSVDVLRSLHGHLCQVVRRSERPDTRSYGSTSRESETSRHGKEETIECIEHVRAQEVARVYRALSRQCATVLGDMLFRPRCRDVEPDVIAAFQWYSQSDTPVEVG